MEIERQYQFSKKSKKYRTKYLDKLGKLYGDLESSSKIEFKATESLKAELKASGNA